MEDRVSDYVTRYYAIVDTLDARQREQAEFARGQALAYLWGRMDTGESIDGLLADAFSWAYGTVQALLEAGKITSRGPIRDSWECFREHAEIRDYNGRALDRVGSVA